MPKIESLDEQILKVIIMTGRAVGDWMFFGVASFDFAQISPQFAQF